MTVHSLVQWRKVGKFWYNNTNETKIYWIRKIQLHTTCFSQFTKEWSMVTKRTPMKTLKEIERTVQRGNYVLNLTLQNYFTYVFVCSFRKYSLI